MRPNIRFELGWRGASVRVARGERVDVDIRVEHAGRLLVVRESDVPDRGGADLDLRASGLWLSLVCETPGEHWTIGLEAFALAVDHPDDERGDLVPLGLDIEWEAPGRVTGELLVGDERIELDEPGTLEIS
jgi:hypothetical protein